MLDFVKFKGGKPYGSALFGVYQPLLGWKSNQNKDRILKEQESKLETFVTSSNAAHITANPPTWLNQALFEYIWEELEKGIDFNKGKPLTAKQWETIFSDKNLARILNSNETSQNPQDSITADVMKWLSKNSPQLILNLFQKNKKPLERQKKFIDPLVDFDPSTQLTVLSPIGITHQFREYFFELETFLGPPVGHVWISPGGVVELTEVNTRRTTTERMVETLFEGNQRSDLITTEQEDLSDAVVWENHQNTKLGISGNSVIYPAEANANLAYDSSHKQAQLSSHKLMREQSEKLSREICRNFKTTFRTSTEVQDSSSRRYVLENKTNKLVNYELHRKMRKVGVQVQHIGTQLCWQFYIYEPGKELGLAELVHIAKPTDIQASAAENYQQQDHGSYSDYIKAVQERTKFASNIRKRNSAELREEERIVVYQLLLRQLMQLGPDQTAQVTSEIVRSIFDVDNMLYFAASDWWKPRERSNYLITKESEPAPLGSSLGWQLQLDGDNHRNAFLNSPWVKVVMPVLPGRETAALNWLQLEHIEGMDGLDALYSGPEKELEGKTIVESLQHLAKRVTDLNTAIENTLAAEAVFENGFNPLEQGFQATGESYEVFDQWTVVLPTDQIVALEYDEHAAKR